MLIVPAMASVTQMLLYCKEQNYEHNSSKPHTKIQVYSCFMLSIPQIYPWGINW